MHARVAATARSGEVLVSNTVKDLVAGSEIQFTDRGSHALKGIPTSDTCHLRGDPPAEFKPLTVEDTTDRYLGGRRRPRDADAACFAGRGGDEHLDRVRDDRGIVHAYDVGARPANQRWPELGARDLIQCGPHLPRVRRAATVQQAHSNASAVILAPTASRAQQYPRASEIPSRLQQTRDGTTDHLTSAALFAIDARCSGVNVAARAIDHL
jgi:hypothetical protein